jgi:hypothetical protein
MPNLIRRLDNLATAIKPRRGIIIAWQSDDNPELYQVNGALLTRAETKNKGYDLVIFVDYERNNPANY